MKKTIKLLCGMILLLSLTGCVNISMNYAIDEKHKVSLIYHVQADLSEVDEDSTTGIQQVIKNTVNKYEEYGFIVTGSYTEDQIDFILTLEEQADNYEEAYKILEGWLTDPEISFFLKVDMDTASEEYEQVFNFYAETDFNKIVESTNLDYMPPSIRNSAYNGMDNSKIEFTLTLPHLNIVEVNTGVEVEEEKRITVFRTPISWEEPTIIDFTARMSLDNGEVVVGTMDQSIQKTKDQINLYQLITYGCAAGAVVGVGGIAYLLIKRKKKDS